MNTEIREVKAEVYIPLTQGQVAVVDFDDFESLRDFSWYAKWCSYRKAYAAARSEFDPEKYARLGRNNCNKTVWMHQQIMAAVGKAVDHINLNPLDNRRDNLRFCTPSQNRANSKKTSRNKSGFKGVCWHKTKQNWEAHIGVNYKTVYLGGFNTAEEAAQAYDTAAKQHFGEFARLNFPSQPVGGQ